MTLRSKLPSLLLLLAATLFFTACESTPWPDITPDEDAPTTSVAGADLRTDPSADPADGQVTDLGPLPSEGAPNWEATTSRGDLDGLVTAQISEMNVAEDGKSLRVRFFNSSEPCAGARVTVAETDVAVSVHLETGISPQAASATCPAEVQPYEIQVNLDEPFGDRELHAAAPTPTDLGNEAYLGLTEEAARDRAEAQGSELRVVAVDGVDVEVTDDLRETRVNVAIDDGVVSSVYNG